MNATMKKPNSLRHGHTAGGQSPTYMSWGNMKSRCLNPNSPVWKDYGGRGISVCQEWMKFENFLRDMGERADGMEIDRIDNERGYEPANCRWATSKTQNNNRRSNRIVELDGKLMTLTQAAERTGINIGTLWWRLNTHGSLHERPTKKRLSEPVVRMLRERHAQGIPIRELALAVGRKADTVRDAIKGRTWRNAA